MFSSASSISATPSSSSNIISTSSSKPIGSSTLAPKAAKAAAASSRKVRPNLSPAQKNPTPGRSSPAFSASTATPTARTVCEIPLDVLDSQPPYNEHLLRSSAYARRGAYLPARLAQEQS